MFFSLLLWIISWYLRFKLLIVFKKLPSIKEELQRETIFIQVQTQNQESLRSFVLQNGVYQSFRKELELPGLLITFPDGKTGREVFKALRKDKNQIFNLIQEKKIAIIYICLITQDHLRLNVISRFTASAAHLEPMVEGQI